MTTTATRTLVQPKRIKRFEDPEVVLDDRGVLVVRLLEASGNLSAQYNGGGTSRVRRVTLGGRVTDQFLARDVVIDGEDTVKEPRAAIAAARTADTIDVGRFMLAVNALVALVDKAGADASPEQQQEILRSYQGLLAWHEELQRSVARVDGALEVATRKVRGAF